MQRFKTLLAYIFILSCLCSCGKESVENVLTPDYRLSVVPGRGAGFIKIKVFDSKTLLPINNTDLIFSSNGAEQIIKTSITGEGKMPTSLINGNIFSVTAKAKGYTLVTLYKLQNQEYDIFLPLKKAIDDSNKIKVRGTVSNFHKIKSNDGVLDFGLTLPFLELDRILSLNPSVFLSPTVTVNIVGDREIPGNIVIPRQTEYFFVTLKKENFELDMEAGKSIGMSTVSASAPTSITSALSDGNVFEVFKLISMKKIGIKFDYIPSTTFLNFPLDYDLKPKLEYSCIVPDHSEIVNLALLSTTSEGFTFIPTGFAVADNNAPNGVLATPEGIDLFDPFYSVISIASDTKTSKKTPSMSAILKRNLDSGKKVFFNDYLKYFSLYTPTDYSYLKSDFKDVDKTSINLTKLVKYSTSSKKEVTTTMYWEIYSPKEEEEIDLSLFANNGIDIASIMKNMTDNESLRFIQMHFAVAARMGLQTFDESLFLKKITHASIAELVLKSSKFD